MERKKPMDGEFYRHFKGNIYQIKMVAFDAETCEEMVVYQAMYPPFANWVRKLSDFQSMVDKKKYPEITQKYRFEQICFSDKLSPFIQNENSNGLRNKTSENLHASQGKNENLSADEVKNQDLLYKENISDELFFKAITSGQPDRYLSDKMTEQEIAERGLMQLLDAESFHTKRQIFMGLKQYITPLLLNNIAVALDIVLEDEDEDQQYDSILSCLSAFERYEGGRLR